MFESQRYHQPIQKLHFTGVISQATMMSKVFLYLSLVGICLATPFELEPLSDAHIFYINSVQSSWKAGRNFHPEEFETVKGLLGVDAAASELYSKLHPLPVSDIKVREDLPKQFDSRVQWPNCTSIGEIRDQSVCGSSWAFGPAEAMTDRRCIHTKTPAHISVEDLNDCCTTCGDGCFGGIPQTAWKYYETEGVVTGGNYNSNKGCMPYSLPNCDHYVKGGKYKLCGHIVPSPPCTKRCREGYGKTYKQDKLFGQPAKSFVTEKQMMQEIVDNGPVSATFTVYSDFIMYKSGVYKFVRGTVIGAHAVKIIGYGVENGQDFWLVANSWNEDWGDKGYFKIARGENECGIEDLVVAGLPKQ